MNTDQTREAIKVMQAWIDEKEIEFRKLDQKFWTYHNGPLLWDWSEYDYRIKPVPMEIEVWVSPHGEFCLHKPHSLGNLEWKPKTFREVL